MKKQELKLEDVYDDEDMAVEAMWDEIQQMEEAKLFGE